jgi:hypothetical protein
MGIVVERDKLPALCQWAGSRDEVPCLVPDGVRLSAKQCFTAVLDLVHNGLPNGAGNVVVIRRKGGSTNSFSGELCAAALDPHQSAWL